MSAESEVVPPGLSVSLADRYSMVRELGRGGMATVYLAHDLKHDRDVAIKVLDRELGAAIGTERFQREIETVARLTHPHILPLHDSGNADGTLFYVMPYVEGETLRHRLDREKQLSVEAALQITLEVADALRYAHAHGVIHRDIKPENILLQSGHAVVADFGIAKAIAAAQNGKLTATGLSLGTPTYMSPEQAAGSADLDGRSDLYSLGCVLYEMFTGEPPHTGPNVQAVIAKLLTAHPRPVSELRRTVPVHVVAALDVALAKLPADRFESVDAFSRALIDPAAANGPAARALGRVNLGATTQRSNFRVRWAVPVGLLLVVVAGVTGWTLKPGAASRVPVVARFTAPLPSVVQMDSYIGSVAFSPEGDLIAFGANGADGSYGVYVRALDSLNAKLVAKGGFVPFFSPDGRWIGFVDGAEGKLKKVAVSGGTPQTICDVGCGRPYDGFWGQDGMIYFSYSSEIWKIAESGGTPQRLTTLNHAKNEERHDYPQLVAGGKALLFAVRTGWGWDESQIEAQSLATGERHVLARGARKGLYVSSGHLVYHRGANEELLAAPIDLSRLEPTGPAVRLGEYVRSGGTLPEYAVSNSGSLVYVAADSRGVQRRLVWRDIAGKETLPLPGAPSRPYMDTRLSPDGRYAALQVMDATVGIWLYAFARPGLEPLTRGGTSVFPVWSSDSKRIAYTGIRRGVWGVYAKAIDGSGQEEELLPGAERRYPLPGAWTPDGKRLLLQIFDAKGSDLWILDVVSHKLEPLLKLPSYECCFNLSRDGEWLAYTSDRTGQYEVHLEALRNIGNGKVWQISQGGGSDPRWSPDGRHLYYFSGTKVMDVDLGSASVPDPKPPRLVFEHGFAQTNEREWDISADGKRLLLQERTDAERPATQLHVVLNWVEELKRRLK